MQIKKNLNLDDLEAIRELGQGWVAEETLAIAIYCSLKYSDDFDKAIIASVSLCFIAIGTIALIFIALFGNL